jgi:hypothetical protein
MTLSAALWSDNGDLAAEALAHPFVRSLGDGSLAPEVVAEYVAFLGTDESGRAGLDITVTAVMPRMTPFGEVGRRGVRAYAARTGQTEEAYLQQLGAPLTPEIAGSAVLDLVRKDPSTLSAGYLLTGAGLQPLP